LSHFANRIIFLIRFVFSVVLKQALALDPWLDWNLSSSRLSLPISGSVPPHLATFAFNINFRSDLLFLAVLSSFCFFRINAII
jgi:hypothetical protein